MMTPVQPFNTQPLACVLRHRPFFFSHLNKRESCFVTQNNASSHVPNFANQTWSIQHSVYVQGESVMFFSKRIFPTLAIASLLLAGTSFGHSVYSDPKPEQDKDLVADAEQHSHIDLAICLDTSNSMDGLIDSAKMQLWTIVNTLDKADPKPNLRIALLAYGNESYGSENGWVRTYLDFTEDLEVVYDKLFQLETNGGTEYVSRVTRAAMMQNWSKDNDKVLQMIFVAGNESAKQDTQYPLHQIMKQATEHGIYVNTIYCGNPTDEDMTSWELAAALASGKCTSINPDKQIVYKTPYDADLAKLSEKLDSTYIYYGSEQERRRASGNNNNNNNNALSMNSQVAAERAVSKSSAIYSSKNWDIVELYETDQEEALNLQEERLPEELKGKSKEEIEIEIKKASDERDKIKAQITELNQKRLADIDRQKAAGEQNVPSFEAAIVAALKTQAAEKGIIISE